MDSRSLPTDEIQRIAADSRAAKPLSVGPMPGPGERNLCQPSQSRASYRKGRRSARP